LKANSQKNRHHRAKATAVTAVLAVLGVLTCHGCGKSGDSASAPSATVAVAGGDTSRAAPVINASAPQTGAGEVMDAPDPDIGHLVFTQTCASCHGFQAQGLPHNGAPLRTSKFVASHSDPDLIAFIKTGRPAKDPTNKSGVAMPPRGNNAALSDARLADVVAFLRQVQAEAKADGEGDDTPATASVGTASVGK
jgi:mono/diheme cytochrome c family protein